jgi:PadR family transcriptional regulator
MVRTASKNELLPGTLEMLILQTLTRSAMHGYGIAQHIQEITDEVLQVEEGSLYPALQRLLLKGWVKGEWGTSDNNRRARYYTLTAAGRKQLGIEAENFKRLIEAIARVMQTA